mgnify:CR=1 FL=1
MHTASTSEGQEVETERASSQHGALGAMIISPTAAILLAEVWERRASDELERIPCAQLLGVWASLVDLAMLIDSQLAAGRWTEGWGRGRGAEGGRPTEESTLEETVDTLRMGWRERDRDDPPVMRDGGDATRCGREPCRTQEVQPHRRRNSTASIIIIVLDGGRCGREAQGGGCCLPPASERRCGTGV